MKKYVIMIVCMTILLTLGCSKTESPLQGNVVLQQNGEQEIRIGASLFLSGNDLSFMGQAIREGIEVAVEEINTNGGILGRPVRVIYEDDQLNSEKAANIAHRFVSVDRVHAALGGAANTAKAAGPVFEQARIPNIILWDANKDVEAIGKYVYGTGFSTEAAGYSMAEELAAQGIKNVSIIRHQDEWSQLIANSFEERFVELGGKVSLDESLPLEANDFKTVLTKARESDAIYAPLVVSLDLLFKQARELGYDGILATGDGMSAEVIANAHGAAEGVIFTQVYAEGEALNTFTALYEEKYHKENDLLIFSALGYDGMNVLKEAMEKAGTTDPVAVHDALYTIKDFSGAAGTLTMNPEGSAARFEKIFVVKDGESVMN